MYKRLSLLSCSILTLFFVAGCDDYILLDQFETHFALDIHPQRKTVQQGETIDLNPSGGIQPYTFNIVEEDFSHQDTLGSVDDSYNYTAGDSIGKVKILLTDVKGKTVDAVVTIVPMTPGGFNVDGATGIDTTINLTWNPYNKPGIEGFRIMRSEEGGPFILLEDETVLGSGATDYEDTCSPNTLYSYRMHAVAGEYLSPATQNKSDSSNP